MKRTVIFLLVFAFGALTAAAVMHLDRRNYFRERPAFVADLPRSWAIVTPAMKDRILAAVPIGSKHSQLVEFLHEQGFKSQWGTDEWSGWASFNWNGYICPEQWDVMWTLDAQRRITDVSTRYNDVCS
jgi:hypothetical protein